jgi:hypothetical protein
MGRVSEPLPLIVKTPASGIALSASRQPPGRLAGLRTGAPLEPDPRAVGREDTLGWERPELAAGLDDARG